MQASEHKTVRTRILKYAEAIGWTLVSREGKFVLLCVDARRERGQLINSCLALLHELELPG